MSESEGKMMEKDLELRNFKRRYETLEEINKNMEKRLARVEEEVRDKQRQIMDKVQKEIDESKKKSERFGSNCDQPFGCHLYDWTTFSGH